MPPKVSLALASSDGTTATATARIIDGTLSSPVDITAHIVEVEWHNCQYAVDKWSVWQRRWDGDSYRLQNCATGDWRLNSSEIERTAPRGIFLTIDTTSVATILPLVTITFCCGLATTVTVTALVTKGPIGAQPVGIELAIDADTASPRTKTIMIAADTIGGGIVTDTFEGLSSGAHILTATIAVDFCG